MVKKLVLGAVLGGLVVFLWGFLSWVVLPWHQTTLLSFRDEVAVAKVVQANAPNAGMYLLLPYRWDTAALEQQGIPKGLMLFGSVRLESPDMPRYYLRGLGLEMLAALLVTWLLLMLPTMTYANRVKVVVLTAVIAGAMCRLTDWNWWSVSTGFTLLAIADLVIGWAFAGLVIAKVVGDRRTSSYVSDTVGAGRSV